MNSLSRQLWQQPDRTEMRVAIMSIGRFDTPRLDIVSDSDVLAESESSRPGLKLFSHIE